MGKRFRRRVPEAFIKPTCPVYEPGKGRTVAMTKELLSVDDLSEYLNIKKSTLYSMVENGDLPHYRIGRLIRFKRNDVDAWMEKHRRERIEIDKKAKEILKNTTRQRLDINSVVKKSIEEVRGKSYTSDHGKPDRIKGLGKEVKDGTL